MMANSMALRRMLSDVSGSRKSKMALSDVRGSWTSKMAAAKPEMHVSQLVDIHDGI